MTRPRKRNAPPADHAKAGPPLRLSGWKLWSFRLVALMGAPVVCFGLIELVLRLVGYGYPTAFLLSAEQQGQQVFIQNNQFGWRFFGPDRARAPYPFSFPQTKATNTVRIFVFGESAARGDPHPRLSLPAMLEALLSQRYPGVHFEVVNAAMTAINSHVIRPIARDCARAGGDLWVIYLGNNEVVGPCGSGTVFGSQTPALPVIRATLALKTTRTGQALDALGEHLSHATADQGEWGGMKMFLAQQVSADDPRMPTVYHHFQHNLAAILRTGRRSGAGIVISTVAVNLKDCAPFASAHRRGLAESDKLKWEQYYEHGGKLADAGKHPEAAEIFKQAALLDDRFAELRFRQGQCALALEATNEAQQHFRASRDLDTLRFRCDEPLNQLIRAATTNRESERILLADAERAFTEQSDAGLPGEEMFYEHVHLTFDGNYLLARTLAEQVEKLLPPWAAAQRRADPAWPTLADCSRRLAWSDWERAVIFNKVLAIISAPPFTGQLNHAAQQRTLQDRLREIPTALQPAGVRAALGICERAIATAPEDAALQSHLAVLKQAAGDLAGATVAARRGLEMLPSNSQGWYGLGMILAQDRKFAEAAAAFQRAYQQEPRDVVSLENFAQALAAGGRNEEAVRAFRSLLKLKPGLGGAWLHLGQTLERLGRPAEAEECYRQALAKRAATVPDLLELAAFGQSRGNQDAAVECLAEAAKLSPTNAKLHAEIAQSLAAMGRLVEATRYSAEAVRLAPEAAESHQLHGAILWQQNQIGPAEEQFRATLRLKPDLIGPRLNLGMALIKLGREAEALGEFEQVLQQNPTNAAALQYREWLRAPRPAR